MRRKLFDGWVKLPLELFFSVQPGHVSRSEANFRCRRRTGRFGTKVALNCAALKKERELSRLVSCDVLRLCKNGSCRGIRWPRSLAEIAKEWRFFVWRRPSPGHAARWIQCAEPVGRRDSRCECIARGLGRLGPLLRCTIASLHHERSVAPPAPQGLRHHDKACCSTLREVI